VREELMEARTVDTEFYLAPGGPVDRLQQRLWSGRTQPPRLGLRALVTAIVVWAPMVVLNFLQPGSGADIPFHRDIAAHARFLLIIPLLIIAEGSIGNRSRLVVSQFLSSGLVADTDADRFERAVKRGRRLLESWVAELFVGVLTALLVWIGIHGVIVEPTVFWFESPDGACHGLSLAGWWYAAVATPVFVFLALRWVWRYLIWWWFLGRVASLDLRLAGTHPDRMGGLAFVSFHQASFAILTFAAGCAVSAAAANRILYAGATLMSYKAALIAIIIGSALIGLLPLLVFTPHLVRAKRTYWTTYSRFASDYVWSFQQKWLGKKDHGEEALGSGDIQSLADLGGSFDRLVGMRPVAIDRRLVVSFLFAAAAPILPLVLTVMPLRDIIKMLLKAMM
jgi:hypothetical protein